LIWQVNSDRIETLQLEAARIDTGLTGYTSLDSIYRETGWEKLSTRREVKKLCKFYKSNVGFYVI
jgi:predicted aspartyl protease